MAPKLKPNGKPMRALRVLGEDGGPMEEVDVYIAAHTRVDQTFDRDLGRLVRLGLAERSRVRGRARYAITPAGREYLAAVNEPTPAARHRPGAVTHTREDPLA